MANSKLNKRPEKRPDLDTFFINSDASSNDGLSYHNEWIEKGVAVTSGGPIFLKKLMRLVRGNTLLLWADGYGVVAAGMVVDDKPVTIRRGADTVSPNEPEEYQRKVAWYADLRSDPIKSKEVVAFRGSNPRGPLSESKTGKDAILALVEARAEKIDMEEIEQNKVSRPTETEVLRQARLGQGIYRNGLLNLWGRKCAVTGCDLEPVLRASHALPWKSSTDDQRLDPNNGLPLVATLDALFDRGLIGFGDDGNMLCSPLVQDRHRTLFGLPVALRKPLNERQKQYLMAHRLRFALD